MAEKSKGRLDWTREEVEAAVTDYFSMLSAELTGLPYSKTAHRRRLRNALQSRSDGSLEFKHQTPRRPDPPRIPVPVRLPSGFTTRTSAMSCRRLGTRSHEPGGVGSGNRGRSA